MKIFNRLSRVKTALTFFAVIPAALATNGCASQQPPIAIAAPLADTCRIAVIRQDLFVLPQDNILVAAHRGFHRHLPENSLPSISEAANAGIDIVEIDVRLSRDGVPVLMHDASLRRTTGLDADIATLTFRQLQALRLRDKDQQATQEKIPTLAQALQAAKGRVWVQIDLKATSLEAILAVVRSENMLDQVSFFHSDPKLLNRLLSLAPEAIVMPIAKNQAEFDRLSGEAAYKALHLTETTSTEANAARLDALGKPSWVNSLGELDRRARDEGNIQPLRALIEQRPDIIQTDIPDQLLAWLRAEKLHWSSSRTCP